ncbi:DUF4258 domain-containing protein [Desulfobacula sp.]|uniref:DUF4258 domain-containing protein n=1 Tax=Desulfobacula sp. TaxID=2593537 RepID=UPI001ECF9056|nr:DUF4258 domain-containing protein [Desulfobacula sp.]
MYEISIHARKQMRKRGIAENTVRDILSNPQQNVMLDNEICVYQSKIKVDKKDFLVRVFVNILKNPNNVVTVYRTSQINKYWI